MPQKRGYRYLEINMADVSISQLNQGTPGAGALIPFSQGGSTLATLASSLTAGILSSVIKQIQFNYYDGVWNTSSTSIQEVTNYNVNITPSSTSSKILIFVSGYGGSSFGGGGNDAATFTGLLGYLYRYTTAGGAVQLPLPGYGGQSSSLAIAHFGFTGSSQYDMTAATCMMVDQPNTTAQVTYKIYARAMQPGYTGYINRTGNGATGWLTRSWIYAVEF